MVHELQNTCICLIYFEKRVHYIEIYSAKRTGEPSIPQPNCNLTLMYPRDTLDLTHVVRASALRSNA